MCLACEMDALWFAELEAAAARAPGTAGVSPAVPDSATSPTPVASEKARVTPAAPGFRCEETGSE
jgi:hypothetical protein